MLKRYLANAVICLAIAITPQVLFTQTLPEVLTYGYQNSGLVAQQRALLRVADEDIASALAALRPDVSWNGETTATLDSRGTDNDVTSALELALEITLFDGGANRTNIAIKEETFQAALARLRGIEQDVLLRIVDAYFDVQKTYQIVSLQRASQDLLSQQLQAIQLRRALGETTQTDVSIATAQLAEAGADLVKAQGDYNIAQSEFQAAVGKEPGSLQDAGAPSTSYSLPDAREIALRQHPDILQAQHQLNAAEHTIIFARAALSPSGTLRSETGLDDASERTGMVRLTVDGPVYSGGRLSSIIRQAQAERDEARARLIITIAEIDRDIANAYTNLHVAEAEIAAAERGVIAAKTAFDSTQQEAQLGSRTALDVLDANQELLAARTDLVSARIAKNRSGYAILAAMGLLTVDALELPVQEYQADRLYRSPGTTQSAQGRALDRILGR